MSDICDIGLVIWGLVGTFFGDGSGLVRPFDFDDIGALVALRNENVSNEGGREDLGDLTGGCGAGLGLKNRSGSSGTFSRAGLKGNA